MYVYDRCDGWAVSCEMGLLIIIIIVKLFLQFITCRLPIANEKGKFIAIAKATYGSSFLGVFHKTSLDQGINSPASLAC